MGSDGKKLVVITRNRLAANLWLGNVLLKGLADVWDARVIAATLYL
jgi:hypothetical protein